MKTTQTIINEIKPLAIGESRVITEASVARVNEAVEYIVQHHNRSYLQTHRINDSIITRLR